MIVNISVGQRKKLFTVSSGKPNTVFVKTSVKKSIKLNIFRDGASAYEIAVRNGTFQGTEEEFSQEQIHPEIDFLAHYLLAKN